MSARTTIDKLKIIAEMSQAAETKQLCTVMIEYIKATDQESKEFGFKASDAEAES
ncbi:hypothetical protein [Gordonia terrae]|uniref:hypothetical protein n=1 Tax=Gordonia terrae TaxID=2055 RepID=UPI00039F12C6|nr:hypothetical protein [Gordonia terrae]